MLTELFKTKERVRIISYIMYQKNFTVNKVSNETGVTKGLVSRYLRYAYGAGLLTKAGQSYQPKDCANTRAIKLLLNLNKINIESLDADWTTGIGVFGSWAQGTNTNGSRIVVEAYPKLVAMKWIGKCGYKNDTKKKQSDEQKTARSEIVRGLCSGELRSYYGFDIELSEKLKATLIEDPTGDNLDALLCAVQTGWAYEQRDQGYGIPADCDPLEGWIVDPDLLY